MIWKELIYPWIRETLIAGEKAPYGSWPARAVFVFESEHASLCKDEEKITSDKNTPEKTISSHDGICDGNSSSNQICFIDKMEILSREKTSETWHSKTCLMLVLSNSFEDPEAPYEWDTRPLHTDGQFRVYLHLISAAFPMLAKQQQQPCPYLSQSTDAGRRLQKCL